ncbi:unnamed protein product [Merluccius merluccius]
MQEEARQFVKTDDQDIAISPYGPCDNPVHQSECIILMAMMSSKKHQELEGRLEDMLSRIAMETLEIKHLEQQLTEGQILVNTALQTDLQGIISGIQDYIGGLRQQARGGIIGLMEPWQFHGGLDLLFEALVSGQDGFRSNGLEEMLSDRLRQMYQDIQQYVAEQIRRAQEQVQQNHDQQNPDKQMQGEKLREELKEARSSLQNSQAQVQHLQHTMLGRTVMEATVRKKKLVTVGPVVAQRQASLLG